MTEAPAKAGRPMAAGPDGVVLLDKPVGLSSNAALQRVKRLFRARKAGHTGSLDPLASGLLPICLGQATRFSGFLLDAAKAYEVSAVLGARTATGDAEGEVVERCAWTQVEHGAMEAALAGFRGRQTQVPPMYSALKQGGEPLYRKARRGEVVERAPRAIQISRLELTHWAPPVFGLALGCSKGTYVRTLVEDLGRAVGSCAHVAALRRVGAGPYDGARMYTLAVLEALAEEGPEALARAVLPMDSALSGLPALSLDGEAAARLLQGQPVPRAAGSAPGLARLYGPAGFIGLGETGSDLQLRAKRLLATSGSP
jgi:tRNA pseudouridine55 synthase